VTTRISVERFDTVTITDPAALRHLAFVRDIDAVASRHGRRSWVLPERCPGCARLARALTDGTEEAV